MSYDIYRVFVNGTVEPSIEDIHIGMGGNCVPRFNRQGYDDVQLYADAIILSVKRLGKTYNILYWKRLTDDGEETWDTSLFSPVPSVFRWRTGADPIYFPQVIKPEAVRHAALGLIQKLVWSAPESLSKEDIAACFYTYAEVNKILLK